MDNWTKIKNGLADAIDGVMKNKGVIAIDKETGYELPLDLGEDKVEIQIHSKEYFDYHMVSYVLMNMIKEGKMDFCCDENDKDFRYLCKLLRIDKEE